MRIKIILESIVDKNIVLPIHYNHLMQAFIYHNISNELAIFLHNHGFEYEKRRFKLFVFSRIFAKKAQFYDGKAFFDRQIYFYLSSPLDNFISQFAEHILKRNHVSIFGNMVAIKEIYVLPEPEFKEEHVIKMLSPVTVYSTLLKGTKKKTYYYSPVEKEFSMLIKENLGKKYFSFYEESLNFIFEMKPEKVNKNLEKIVIYKNTVIKGWLGTYTICSCPEIIKFAYHTGLGAKNSQGFGMFDICS
ncbi:MAG: CRISPR-associated endoribonuclease Cas6 [Candidatus Omnitrophica bacterium]|nr:CRISPR-associated endoribonuclease Cas6 [Candidatus Omnitrophota bacterium]